MLNIKHSGDDDNVISKALRHFRCEDKFVGQDVLQYLQVLFSITLEHFMTDRSDYMENETTTLLDRPCKINNSIPDKDRGLY